MKNTKVYSVLYICNMLQHGPVSPKYLREVLDINDKQLWNYIRDIKTFIKLNSNYSLKYSKSIKKYYLEKRE